MYSVTGRLNVMTVGINKDTLYAAADVADLLGQISQVAIQGPLHLCIRYTDIRDELEPKASVIEVNLPVDAKK